ncbi:MAG: GAF domain-containing protein, partial [Caldimonas sp.]
AQARQALAQRSGELAIIDAIQQAVSAGLGFQAIVDLVGDKLREVFRTGNVNIAWWDDRADTVQVLYRYEHGRPLPLPPPWPRDRGGPVADILRDRQPRVANTRAEQTLAGVAPAPGTDWAHSLAGVAIVGSKRTLGVIGLQNHEREYAFGAEEVRLLQTIAASMGVALENARLFDETQRLLKEAEQRNAGLAVITSIQQGIAGSLSFQSIVELVGEKLRELLRVDTIGIRWYDHATRTAHFLYEIERGTRVTMAPVTASAERWREVTSDRDVIVRNTAAEVAAAGVAPGTECSLSTVSVKIVAGDRVAGVVLVESFECEHAFGEAEVRLLQTIVGEMGVALENAHLFDETQRLLKEAEQRNAELAVINSIQQGMAAELSFQGIVDLVGDKLREVFASDDVGIRWHDPKTDLIEHLYVVRRGERQWPAPTPPSPQGAWRQMQVARQPVVANSQREMVELHLIAAPDPEACRSLMGVPILSGDRMLGLIGVESDRDDAFSPADVRLLATVAASMGLALENVRLFNETRDALHKVEQRTGELAEALDYQTAISDVLRVISRSPTDVAPVFEAILDCATRLFGSAVAAVYRYDDGLVHLVAARNWPQQALEVARTLYPAPPTQALLAGRVILSGSALSVDDALVDASYNRAFAQAGHWRRMAGAPMLKDGEPIGAILVAWPEPGPTPQRQVELFQTFADQAVIAIENVRLINETKEALEQQTATAEILRVISSSPSDVQPVFDAITERAMVLCGGTMGAATRFDGELLHMVSYRGTSAQAEVTMRAAFPMRVSRGSSNGRAILARVPVRIADVRLDPEYQLRDAAELSGWTSSLSVPLLLEGRAVGAISVQRPEPGLFPEKSIELLETFARQAVLAIENVRLFNETREALERQTATAEILRVISGSITDTQPVFEAIVQSCRRLFGGKSVHLAMPRGDMIEDVAFAADAPAPKGVGFLKSWPLDRASGAGSCILDGRVVVVADTEQGAKQFPRMRDLAIALGYRSCLFVPLLKDGKALGALTILRETTGTFDDQEV